MFRIKVNVQTSKKSRLHQLNNLQAFQYGILLSGKPMLLKAPAKPKPCSKPKANATSHGFFSERRSLLSVFIANSCAKNTIDKAMTASTGAIGKLNHPNEVPISVSECATVKAVIVAIKRLTPVIKKSKASTKSKWSIPKSICSMV